MNFYLYPVTLGLIVACVAVYFLAKPNSTYQYGILPVSIKRGQYYRLVTAAFLHASPYHLFLNMYALYNLGSFLEPYVGSVLFALLLFLSIIGGSALVTMFGRQDQLTIGMSGGLYGLLGYYVMLLWKLGLFANQAIRYSILRTLLVNLIISFMPGISLLGHLGGFIIGLVFGIFL